MADASTPPRKRPLSPHLSIWKPGPAMAVSILHRISGDGLALIGLPLLLWWLHALAGGPEAYAQFLRWVWMGEGDSWVQQLLNAGRWIVWIGLSWAFFEHLLSGLRHFVLDVGAGYELKANALWSWVVLIGSVVLTAAFWAKILLG